jgi:NADH-quinone oxidoreductase subunit L
MMALAGVPFLFSGFWSKEAILHAAHLWPASHLPLYMGLAAVVLTAFYMTRLVAEAFFGQPRTEAASHAHESPRAMTLPLIILAVCTVLLGFLGTPHWPWLQQTLDPQFKVEHGSAGLMITSIVLVAIGLGSGWALYGRRLRTKATAPDPIAAAMPRVFHALAARLGFDELYAATVGRLGNATATFSAAMDRWVWDGAIRYLSRLGEFVGLVNRETDEDLLNGGFNVTSESLRATGKSYSRSQTGEVHSYLRIIAVGFVLLVLAVVLGGRS